MLQTNTINKFQHFPFHLVDPSKDKGNLLLSIGNNNFHTSAILNSPIGENSATYTDRNSSTMTVEDQLLERNRLIKEKIKELEEFKIKYKDKQGTDLEIIPESQSTSYEEGFPWFVDSEGKLIDFNKEVNLVDSIKLVSRYLETRFGVNSTEISEVQISQILEPLKNSENVTVLELFNHVQTLYKKNESLFTNIRNQSLNISDTSPEGNSSASLFNLGSEHPLGRLGDMTINEVIVKFRDLNWEGTINNFRLTVNTLPATIHCINYGILIRNFMKHVHNRPFRYPENTSGWRKEVLLRRKQLAVFSIIGAPLLLIGLNYVSPSFKDLFTIDVLPSNSNSENNSNNLITSGTFFAIFSQFKNKLPNWFKIIIILILSLLLLYKFLGSNLILFIFSKTFIMLYCYVGLTIAITYFLIEILLLTLFSKKNKIHIPKNLPSFLKDFLNTYQILGEGPHVDSIKNMSYYQLSFYIVLLIFFLFIF